MARRWGELALRYGLLFALGMALVAGFWFHAEFYQLGLLPLLLVGGLAVLLVVLSARILLAGPLPLGRRPVLVLDAEDGATVRSGARQLLVLPAGAPVPPSGAYAEARSVSGARLGNLYVRRVYRRRLEDVTQDEAVAAGHRDAETLRRRASAKAGREGLVTLVRVELSGGRP